MYGYENEIRVVKLVKIKRKKSLLPPFQSWNGAGSQPGQNAVHSTFLHLFHTEALHLFGGVDLGWSQKSTLFITHRTIFLADAPVFFTSSAFGIFIQRETTTLTKFVGIHTIGFDGLARLHFL